MKKLLLLLCLLLIPVSALAYYPPAVPYGDLFVQPETPDAAGALPMCSGPGEAYYCYANGEAAGISTDWVQGFCVENGYTLVQVEIGLHHYRFGWVKGEYTDTQADFFHAAAVTTRAAELTDDPLGQRGTICDLPEDTAVTWLAAMGSAWIYVEAEADGVPVRGFVLRDRIHLLEPEEVYAGKLYRIREGGLWGYMDYQGNVVIQPQYAAAGEFRGAGYAQVRTCDGYLGNCSGIIDMRGEWAVEPRYCIDNGYDGWLYGDVDTGVVWICQEDDEGYYHSLEGFFDFASGYYSGLRYLGNAPWVSDTDALIAVGSPDVDDINNTGYIDRTTGEVVLDFRYGSLLNPMYFEEGYTTAVTYSDDYEEERLFIIDKTGKELVLPEGVYLDDYGGEHFSEGLLLVCNETHDLYGFINTQGELVIPLRYTDAYGGFIRGMCAVQYNGRWGFIDHNGEWAIQPVFDKIWSIGYSAMLVRQGESWLLIDRAGRTLYNFGTERPRLEFSVYGVAIANDGLMLDMRGNELLPRSSPYVRPEYAYDYTFDSKTFEEGLQAMANLDGLMGYIDTQGNEAISFVWDKAFRFRNGLAMVVRDGRIAYINHDGEIVWQEE